jgi:hypothetical protein
MILPSANRTRVRVEGPTLTKSLAKGDIGSLAPESANQAESSSPEALGPPSLVWSPYSTLPLAEPREVLVVPVSSSVTAMAEAEARAACKRRLA